ncbi:MAG: NUDIX hydrolase [Rhizobiales bacterium]|nr:NUDIX hydrolase [Hyphomicrobiales bacterium]
MTDTKNPLVVRRIDRLDLHFDPVPWRFAEQRRDAILAHFETLRCERPALWNGPVLVLHRYAFGEASLEGGYLQTDFASFIAWRDFGFPDADKRNCFSHAAVLSADGAFLLGEMGPQTANHGKVYFPGGTPDPSDIIDGRVDLGASVRRELGEETGIGAGELDIAPYWYCVHAPPRIALIKLMRSRETADTLRARVHAHLAAEREPELSGIRLVRGPADLDGAVLDFVQVFLKDFWNRGENA